MYLIGLKNKKTGEVKEILFDDTLGFGSDGIDPKAGEFLQIACRHDGIIWKINSYGEVTDIPWDIFELLHIKNKETGKILGNNCDTGEINESLFIRSFRNIR